MIKIIRPPKPAFLSEPGNKWEAETLKAIDHYTRIPVVKEFDYNAYNDAKLKAELMKIFVKCAYCESKYDQSSDGDIEHFRPKGRIHEKNPQTPGYYWLANDWDNLLLSCQHCNQRRNHILEGYEKPRGAGKLDQFPLKDDTKRATHHTSLLVEEEKVRLLLNPCAPDDYPEKHFRYEPTKSVMVPLTPKGEKSIEVYALSRHKLVAERNQKKIFLFKQIAVTKRELERHNADPSKQNKLTLKEELKNLMYYTNADQPYAGMCRFFVNEFLRINNIK